ncbi:hypothetical protein KUTeg_017900 [Tegillarca granosa]|uniref:DNA-directed RNA polymerase II subunit GRINL1A n=1 Tax=Tegillarca granosa TaxID=220873 RepID=A0ABQ9EL53_TEGGR|nr:hypothetical protein KUTeg_017900 [Tegillarca granosa]
MFSSQQSSGRTKDKKSVLIYHLHLCRTVALLSFCDPINMALPQEKQGYLEDLSKKTTVELKELLNRQESLLKKKKFLSTLPDKGEKVNKFRDLLLKLITQREENEQRTQQKITERLDVKRDKNPKDSLSKADIVMKQPSRFVQKRKEIQIKKQKNMSIDPGHTDAQTSSSQLSECLIGISTSDQTPDCKNDKSIINKDFKTLRDKSEGLIIGLEDSLQNLNIEDEHCNQEEDITNFSNYELKNIKKFNKNSTYMNTKFKPNSSLKNRISDSLSSDGEPLNKVSNLASSTDVADNQTSRNRDLALEGPVYKYNKTKLISLEDSIHLQRVQKKISEEIQARHAAERLAERLNFKMETYNSEGTDIKQI